MTTDAYRYNIEPVLFCVAFVVMISLRLLSTIALVNLGGWQYAYLHGVIDSGMGFSHFWVLVLPPSARPPTCNLTLLSLSVIVVVGFGFFGRWVLHVVCALTHLARGLKSIFSCGAFIKGGNRLNFFALRAVFCYDCFRHGFFLFKKSRLEPVAAQTAVGSLYCSILMGGVK